MPNVTDLLSALVPGHLMQPWITQIQLRKSDAARRCYDGEPVQAPHDVCKVLRVCSPWVALPMLGLRVGVLCSRLLVVLPDYLRLIRHKDWA